MKIIINADDLGISKKVNDTIFELLSEGFISSTTLLANGPAIEDAIGKIPSYGNCSFGIHLNISEFKPLTNSINLQCLLNNDGSFKKNIQTVYITRTLKKAIFMEWCAQIEKIIDFGINISHIDSHNHVHTSPKLFFVLKKLQKKYNIRKVRITKNIYTDYLPCKSMMLYFKKQFWIFLLKNYFATKTTSGFSDLISFLDSPVRSKFKHNTVEIMVHPGSDLFRDDLPLLKSGQLNKLPQNIALQNYNDLT